MQTASAGTTYEPADVHTASPEYAARFTGPAGEWLLQIQERTLLEILAESELGDLTKLSALDVGGSHGQIAPILSRLGCDLTLLASSPECVTQVVNLVRSNQCKFELGDFLKIPFADRSFDLVTTFRLLPHCENWPQLLAELCRVTRGSIVFDYPTVQSLNYLTPLFFGAKRGIEKNTRPYRLFSHAEIKGVLAKNGFVLRQRKAQFFFPMVIHRALKLPKLSAAVESVFRTLGLTGLFGSPVICEAVRES